MTRQDKGYGSYKSYKLKRKIAVRTRLHTRFQAFPSIYVPVSGQTRANLLGSRMCSRHPTTTETNFGAGETLTHIVRSSMTGGSDSKPLRCKDNPVPALLYLIHAS